MNRVGGGSNGKWSKRYCKKMGKKGAKKKVEKKKNVRLRQGRSREIR